MRCLLRPTDYTTHGTQCSAHSLIKKKRTQEYKNLPSFIILEKKTYMFVYCFLCLSFPLWIHLQEPVHESFPMVNMSLSFLGSSLNAKVEFWIHVQCLYIWSQKIDLIKLQRKTRYSIWEMYIDIPAIKLPRFCPLFRSKYMYLVTSKCTNRWVQKIDPYVLHA